MCRHRVRFGSCRWILRISRWQQSPLGEGLTQVAINLLPLFLRADISKRRKWEAFMHLTPNISYPLMLVISVLMLPVMIVRFYMGWMQMVVIDLPLIVASFWSIMAFSTLMAHKVLFPRDWKRAALAVAPR